MSRGLHVELAQLWKFRAHLIVPADVEVPRTVMLKLLKKSDDWKGQITCRFLLRLHHQQTLLMRWHSYPPTLLTFPPSQYALLQRFTR